MRSTRMVASWTAVIALVFVLPRTHAQQLPVQVHTLTNGMRLLMVERADEPSIAGGWVAHVGSANEEPGITGIAHLFEHMMFKGTPTIGTRDYERDLEIIIEQERVREMMRQEEAKLREAYRRGEITDLSDPANRTPRLKELEQRFNELIAQQREILVKNEFDQIYTAAGASGMNAFTSEDMTGYFITVPANKIELWMWMESERLLRPVFREFYAERDVVFEERRMRVESTPLGKYEETLQSMFWVAHPYHWPVVGWPSDIVSISKAQADEFYGTFYAPQNIALILVGDFKAAEAIRLAEAYFGRIPRGERPVPDVVTMEPEHLAEKRMEAEVEANPQVRVLWHAVPFGHKDSYALEVLSQLLNGRTGRLYKGLVLGREIATESSAQQDARRWAGMFVISGEAKPGHSPEEVERAIYEELDKLKNEPVPDLELQKVKNNFAAYEYRKLSANFPIMIQLLFYDGLGDWTEINEAGAKYQAVSADDIQRVAKKYFTAENRTVAIYRRKEGTPPADPALEGLTAEQRQMLAAVSQQLRAETDLGRLKGGLEQLKGQAGEAPEEARAFLRAYIGQIEARITELENGDEQ